jgi:hypothetical protein
MEYILINLSWLLIGTLIGAYVCKFKKIYLPYVTLTYQWSIGIYKGNSPVSLSSPEYVKNPVLTCKDILDTPANFVADPFMVKEKDTWYLFFEVLNKISNKGEIGVAISNDTITWKYKKIVLVEPFHLAYPYIFKWQDDFYMIPDCNKNYSVRLYKATEFPYKWTLSSILLGGTYADPSIFYNNGKWWLFLLDMSPNKYDLYLFYSDSLIGPWLKHPNNPIVKGDKSIARPAGRVILNNKKIIRYAQDNLLDYGRRVRAFEILRMTEDDYDEKEITINPSLEGTGYGWNACGIHHIDSHEIGENDWIACVDGKRRVLKLRIMY